MNNRKLLLIIGLTLFALIFVFRNEANEIDKSETYKVKKGDNLSVNISSGDILIKTWNKDEVMIQIVKFDDDSKNNFKVHQSGNTLQINYNIDWDWGSEDNFILTIPNDLKIRVMTGSGDINLESNLRGEINLTTNSGEISISQTTGEVHLRSMGGDISCGNVEGNLNVSTMGGDISINNVSGNANLETKGGDIYTKEIRGNLRAATYGGDIKIYSVKNILSAITYGGDIDIESVYNNADLRSYAGDITLNKAEGNLNVTASAGDIQIKNCTGAVDLTSLSGSIYIELNPRQSSKIKTNYGDIELKIPSNVKVEINASAKTAFENDKLIISDFETFLKKESTRQGNSKKEYSINGGGNSSIELKTNNAMIYIKKK